MFGGWPSQQGQGIGGILTCLTTMTTDRFSCESAVWILNVDGGVLHLRQWWRQTASLIMMHILHPCCDSGGSYADVGGYVVRVCCRVSLSHSLSLSCTPDNKYFYRLSVFILNSVSNSCSSIITISYLYQDIDLVHEFLCGWPIIHKTVAYWNATVEGLI